MFDNFSWIIFFLALLLLLIVIFFPKFGLKDRWKQYKQANQRVLLEDALKYIFDQEQQGHSVGVDALIGKLKISSKRTYDLIGHMAEQDLIQIQKNLVHLSEDGERLALQIIRAHRLWERYLLDEARMPLGQVHDHANRREHGMTQKEIDELDASLGHPLSDPHGDPIPNAAGDFFPYEKGIQVNEWSEGVLGKIVHLEDEPEIAFAQIMAAGLRPGQLVRILEKNQQRVILTDGEQEFTLAPAVAANVYLQELSKEDLMQREAIPLSTLPTQEQAEIVRLDDRCQGFTRRRFLDLGLTPGTKIYPELDNAFGDPRAYRVRGTLIALRSDQAESIWVTPTQTATLKR
jgi:DtxR family Mn-dependent transcriptional regulator